LSATLAELMDEARAHGIGFRLQPDGLLRMRAPHEPPAELVERIKAAKPAIIAALAVRNEQIEATLTEWREGVATMSGMSCPSGIPPTRWAAVITDSQRFTRTFASRAAALGWTARDLWGVHPVAPWHRLDCLGALWLLGGSDILALTAKDIVIRGGFAPLRCPKRHPHPAESVISAWELGDGDTVAAGEGPNNAA
jgi:hypothetical protein